MTCFTPYIYIYMLYTMLYVIYNGRLGGLYCVLFRLAGRLPSSPKVSLGVLPAPSTSSARGLRRKVQGGEPTIPRHDTWDCRSGQTPLAPPLAVLKAGSPISCVWDWFGGEVGTHRVSLTICEEAEFRTGGPAFCRGLQ